MRPCGPWLGVFLSAAMAGLAGCMPPVAADGPHAAAVCVLHPGGCLHRREVEIGGVTRRFRLAMPDAMAEAPALVVLLHGGGGSGERFRRFTDRRFERLAGQRGWMVAYADAHEGYWRDCRLMAGHNATRQGIDEAAFLQAIAAEASDLAGAPLSGLFLVGYSNGGHLALGEALQRPNGYTAVAAIGASLPVAEEFDCLIDGSPPPPVMLVGARADPISPFHGGTVMAPGGVPLGRVMPLRQAADDLAARIGGEAAPPQAVPGSGNEPVALLREWRRQGRVVVTLLELPGRGHNLSMPGARFPVEVVGPTPAAPDGPALILEFFAQFVHRPGPEQVGMH